MMGKMGQVWLRQQEVNDHITAQQAALAQMTDKHATAQQVLAAATQEFAGSTSTYSKTAQGHLSNLNNSFQNLTESLGQALLPALDKLVAIGEKVAEWMTRNKTLVLDLSLAFIGLGAAMGLSKGIKAVHSLIGDIGKLAGLVGDLGPAFNGMAVIAADAFGAVQAAAATTFAFIATNPWVLAMLAGVAAITLIATHFREFKQDVVKVWNDITGAVRSAWHGIESIVGKGVDWIWSKIKWLADEAKKLLADTPLGGIIGFGSNLLSGHVGKAFGDLAQGATLGAVNPNAGSVGIPFNNALGGFGSVGGAGNGHITITPQSNISMRMDSREIGKGVVRWALNEAARRPVEPVRRLAGHRGSRARRCWVTSDHLVAVLPTLETGPSDCIGSHRSRGQAAHAQEHSLWLPTDHRCSRGDRDRRGQQRLWVELLDSQELPGHSGADLVGHEERDQRRLLLPGSAKPPRVRCQREAAAESLSGHAGLNCFVLYTVKEPAGINTHLELIEPTRPISKAMFSDRRFQGGFIQVSGPTTTVGGKSGSSPLFTLACDRAANAQIDWSNVDGSGMRQLCTYVKTAKGL